MASIGARYQMQKLSAAFFRQMKCNGRCGAASQSQRLALPEAARVRGSPALGEASASVEFEPSTRRVSTPGPERMR
jgi:hypothetical protein